MRARFWIPLVLGLVVAGPAAAQTVIWHTREACTRERYREPRRRPAQARRDSLWQVSLDSIRADVTRGARAAGAAPEGVLMVQYDVRARTGRMWMAQGSIPNEVLLAAYARAEPLLPAYPYARNGQVLFHTRLDPLPQDTPRSGDVVEECRPEVRNENEIRRLIRDFAERHRGFSGSAAHVTALVARDGQVIYSELSRTSGSGAVDQFAIELFGRMRFSPATVQGVPVDVWVQQPVQVQGEHR